MSKASEYTVIPEKCYILDQLRQKCTYGNMVECELLCERAAKKQICKHTTSDVIKQYMSELARFLFYCSKYLPSPTVEAENIDIALAKTMVGTS